MENAGVQWCLINPYIPYWFRSSSAYETSFSTFLPELFIQLVEVISSSRFSTTDCGAILKRSANGRNKRNKWRVFIFLFKRKKNGT